MTTSRRMKVFFLLQGKDACQGDSGGQASIASLNGQHTLVKKGEKNAFTNIPGWGNQLWIWVC